MIENEEIYTPVDKNEVSAITIISHRMREAREDLCKHKLSDAAHMLGVSYKDLLSYENAIGLKTIPVWVIKRAAEVFAVSADWLCGIVDDDWELCPEIRRQRDFLAIMERLHVESYSKTMATQLKHDKKLEVLSKTVTAMLPAIKAVDETIVRFWEINPEFNEMKGGASVLHKLDKAGKTAQVAKCQLTRFKCLPFDEHAQDVADEENCSDKPYPTSMELAWKEAWQTPSKGLASPS